MVLSVFVREKCVCVCVCARVCVYVCACVCECVFCCCFVFSLRVFFVVVGLFFFTGLERFNFYFKFNFNSSIPIYRARLGFPLRHTSVCEVV